MRRARRSTIVLTAVFVLSALVAISAMMMLLASPASVQKEMIQYKALMDSQVAFRLTWWRWPAKARELYDNLEPQVADVDWSLPMATYDEAMARLMFRMDDTSESRFFELRAKGAGNLTPLETRQLLGFTAGSGAGWFLADPVYEDLASHLGFESIDDMLGFRNIWVDYVPQELMDRQIFEYYSLRELYDMWDDGCISVEGTSIPLEEGVLKSMSTLPGWAQDPSADLTREQTQELVDIAMDSETMMRKLLPQLRRNAEMYGIAYPWRESAQDHVKAAYIEERFTQMGLMD